MSATKILWGQILIVFAIVLADDLERDGVDGLAARLPAAARPRLVRAAAAARSTFRRPSSGGGTPTTPMRRRSSSRAPTSPRPAASSSIAVAIGMSVWRAREAKNVETYGSARWAHAGRDRGAPACSGRMASCSGSSTAHYLRHDGPEHVLCFAPTRSGKGVGLVVPSLLTWPGSAIVHDIKGENWQLTAGWRARHRPRAAVRSDQCRSRRLQPAARGAPRRMGGARRPEHRRHPGRSRRRARAAQPLGEDQPLAAGRRHPARPLRRGGQDARRRRHLPVRSQAADRDDAAGDDDDAASRRGRRRIPSSPPPRASCSTSPTTSAPACCRPPCRSSASIAIRSSPR